MSKNSEKHITRISAKSSTANTPDADETKANAKVDQPQEVDAKNASKTTEVEAVSEKIAETDQRSEKTDKNTEEKSEKPKNKSEKTDKKSKSAEKAPKSVTKTTKTTKNSGKGTIDSLDDKRKPLGDMNPIVRPFVALGRYLHDSWLELRLVRWPDRKATWKMTIAVLIYCAIMMVFILLLDTLFTFLFNLAFK